MISTKQETIQIAGVKEREHRAHNLQQVHKVIREKNNYALLAQHGKIYEES